VLLCLLFLEAADAAGMPRCTLMSLDGSERLELRGLHQGKVLYVDFWASWCSSCAQSFPFLNALETDLRGRGFSVVGINLDENPEDAQRFLGRFPAQFTVLADVEAQCARTFGVRGMPASYVIGREGAIRAQHLGFRPNQAKDLRDLVETLLAETGGGS
jgi:thiol-disulfide isomerase/thioredoxin